MSGDTAMRFDGLSLSEAELVDSACDRFERAWRTGEWPLIEGYLDAVNEPCRQVLLLELLKLELELRTDVGEQPEAVEYRSRFPDQAEAIEQIFAARRAAGSPLSTDRDESLPQLDPDDVPPDANATTLSALSGAFQEVAHSERALGRQLGDYLILDRLGSGGMGVVYRAFQRSAGRYVALKLIKADWCGESTDGSTDDARIRFRNEAQANAQLEHDHIVPVYEIGQVGGLIYFSMRLIKGRSLGQMIMSDGPLSPRRAAYYMEAIARAVQHAHDNAVLHRDIKPGNIMVDENDRPILIDLGLAKSLDATDFTTLTGKALGTPEYTSPEQARGLKNVDHTTDVYGLGATLFALLTGCPPFSGPQPIVVLRKVIDEEPVWPRQRDKPVDRELKALCVKCLEKDPSARIPSAGRLADELRRYLNQMPVTYALPGPRARLVKWVKRQPWRAAAAGMALAAALLLLWAERMWAWSEQRNVATAVNLVRDVQSVALADLPKKIEQLGHYRGLAVPLLRKSLESSPADSEARTRILLALLRSEPQRAGELATRLLTCGQEEHRVIREAIRDRWAEFTPQMRRILSAAASGEEGRRVRAAGALIALDSPGTPAAGVWSALGVTEDPDARVELLEWLVGSKVEPGVLVSRLEIERDDSVRRQLLQALGGLGNGKPPSGIGETLPGRLMTLYRDDPDPGVHSSLGYVLRRWGMEADLKRITEELAGKSRGGRRWYVNSAGVTMAVIDVPEDRRAALPEAERPPARFAIATVETPLALFQEFDPGHAAAKTRVSIGADDTPRRAC